MVSGRAAAALVAELLLAQGRRADLARAPALVADETTRLSGRASESRRGSSRAIARAPRRCRRARVRRPTRTRSITCGASGSCRSMSIRSIRKLDGSAGARAPGARFERGLDAIGRLRAAARPRSERHALAERTLVPAPRALLPDSGRSPIGYRLPLDSLPWVEPRRLSARVIRPIRRRISQLPLAPSMPSCDRQRRRAGPARRAPVPRARRHRALEESGRLDRAHRDVRRAARRRAVRLHAADRAAWRTTSSSSRAVEAAAEALRQPVDHRRLRAAARSAPRQLSR